MSLVPMLAAGPLAVREQRQKKRPPTIERWATAADAFFKDLENSYRDLVQWALIHRLTTVFCAAGILAASLLLLPMIGTEFLPPSDEGEVRVTGEMEVGTRLDLVDRQTRLMEKIVYSAVPETVSSVVSVGASGWRPDAASRGDIRMALSPATERNRSNVEIADDLRRRLSGNIPGMDIRTRAPQGQFLLERLLGGDQGLTIEIRGFALQTLDALAQRVASSIAGVAGITDVDTSREAGVPQQEISVDRDKIADLGLSIRDVTGILETAVKRSLNEILNLTLTTGSGEQVALRSVVTTEFGRGPILIDRKDQQRLVNVTANVSGRDLGSVAADVQGLLDTIPRPAGYNLRVAGNYEEQQKAFHELSISLVLALILVYMVLACQYESLRDPLVVMVSVPVAAVGVLVMLFLTRTTLNLQSCIGCIMLGGIVVNNAILLVDQAGQLTKRGMSVHDAVAEAGRRRLRPILMTTLTTVLALLPLAFGIGEGADAQAPLARAVVGGLTASTLITLVLIPVVYSLFHPEPKEGRK
jgi:HAE1 family hydrophobic/amphiphilic exporter-1